MTQRLLLLRPSGHFSSLIYPDGPWVGVPLNLLYLAAAARKVADVEVKVIDALAWPDFDALEDAAPPVLFGLTLDEIARQALEFAPDVIGVTVAAETFHQSALASIERLRALFPKAFIVAGGTDVSMAPERYLGKAKGLNAIVLGEGELALQGLLTALTNSGVWQDVPGLYHLDAEGKLRGSPALLVQDLDAYTPAWDLIDFAQYFRLNQAGFPSRPYIEYPGSDRAVFLITSRGCPYDCSYCSIHTTMGYRYRVHSPAFVLAQMKFLHERHGVVHFHFEDDNLSLDRERLCALLQGLQAARLPITWDTPNGIRADRFDGELLQLCKQTGCIYLMFGIESGSQQVLDEIANKKLKLTDVEHTLALCKAQELDTMGLFVFGLPGETKETVLQTYNYAFDLLKRYDTVPFFSIYRPYPNTAIYQRCEEKGWLIDARPYERMGKIPYTLFMPVMVETPDLDIWYVIDRYQRYMLRFAAGVLGRALRIYWKAPGFLFGQLWLLLWRILKSPRHFMHAVRSFFWRVLLYPRGQLMVRKRNG